MVRNKLKLRYRLPIQGTATNLSNPEDFVVFYPISIRFLDVSVRNNGSEIKKTKSVGFDKFAAVP